MNYTRWAIPAVAVIVALFIVRNWDDLKLIWLLRYDPVCAADELNHIILGRYRIRWLCDWNDRRLIWGKHYGW